MYREEMNELEIRCNVMCGIKEKKLDCLEFSLECGKRFSMQFFSSIPRFSFRSSVFSGLVSAPHEERCRQMQKLEQILFTTGPLDVRWLPQTYSS